MLLEVVLLLAGLALLTVGGESVVRGSTGLARCLGVSPLMIGLTVLAFGTSAPELAVNLIAAWNGSTGIAFGNIIGSNLANIGAIVGATALIRPIPVTDGVVARELPMMLLATALVVVMAFDGLLGTGPDAYGRGDGLVLLILFAIFLFYTVGDFVRQRGRAERLQERSPPGAPSTARNAALTGIGLAGLLGGAQLTVLAASALARGFGVPEVVIGLTVLAFGTSLPELVASIVATVRRQPELAIGNVVGSNIFNLLLVCGATATLRPIAIPPGGKLDLGMVALLSLVLYGLSVTRKRRIIRGEALALLAAYVAYISWRSLV